MVMLVVVWFVFGNVLVNVLRCQVVSLCETCLRLLFGCVIIACFVSVVKARLSSVFIF